MTRRFPTLEVSDPRHEADGLRHATVFSPALGRRGDCSLWRAPGEGPVPLVVLLHGVYGSHWGWALAGGAHHTAAAMVRTGELAPFALAMPSDGLFGHGSGYLAHRGGDFESWILDDVPALAAKVLAGVDADAPIGLGGLSMGGFGALVLGGGHPDRVRAIAALSAITDFDEMAIFVGDLRAYDVDPARRSAAAVLASCATPPPVLLACGREDLLIDPNRRLCAALEAAGVAVSWIEDAGRHDWEYWRRHLAMALRFLLSNGAG